MQTTTTTARTPAELRDLRADWQHDPIWDIEDTEGFEAHREELLAWRLEREARWTAARNAELRAQAEARRERAEALGCSVELVRRLEALEARCAALEERD